MTEPTIEVTVAAPIEVVWAALRDPAQIRRWHGWDDPTLDDEIDHIFLAGATLERAPDRLVAGGGDTFDLTETPDGVRVRIPRGPRGANAEWDIYYDDITEGWNTFLQQLRFALERHPGTDRRTVLLLGEALRAGDIVDRVGLADVREFPAGTRYRTTLSTGAEISGEVWFRSDRQLGLTVDGYGDGLLILAEAGTADYRPNGGSMALATTYGLPDAAFDEIVAAWNSWWATEFRAEPAPTS